VVTPALVEALSGTLIVVDEELAERIWERWDAADMAGVAAICTTILDEDPDTAVARRVRGGARYHLGDAAGAIADLTRSIELDSDDAWAFPVRGAAREHAGQEEDALADLTRAIELEPDDAWTRARRFGIRARRLGMFEVAQRLLDADELDTDQLVAAALDQFDEAPGVLEDLQRALELDARMTVNVLFPPAAAPTGDLGWAVDMFDTLRWIRPHRSDDVEQILAKAADLVGTGEDPFAALMGLDLALSMRVTDGIPGAPEARRALADLALAEIDRRVATGEDDQEACRRYFEEAAGP
jgi:tetratricopeptide (TPR) repeat protein